MSQNAHISTLTNGSLGTQIFLSLCACVGLYLVFFYDWTPLRQVRLQSPITFIAEEQTASANISPLDGGKSAEIRRDTIRTAAAFDLSAVAKAENIKLGEEDLTLDQKRQAYIKKYATTAVAEMHKYGIPASITIAQGLLETRAGTSKLATGNNNHFGMKCFSQKCKRGHCSNFSDDSHKDFFLKFKSAWESYRAHSKMLRSGRYKKISGDYLDWAQGLEDAGYATVKNEKGEKIYAESLIRLIRLYNLSQLDKL